VKEAIRGYVFEAAEREPPGFEAIIRDSPHGLRSSANKK